ncbi:Hypp5946 [Branchiostoma lanceolatum]|uniref:Hypp5946 protein n=1 Tax=Branchiostoma lanceolatum TaxID=7740 RepID=A0A8J9VLF4_BRALA|nr:Hypp5946 [Branchiostoma lanceolatum]
MAGKTGGKVGFPSGGKVSFSTGKRGAPAPVSSSDEEEIEKEVQPEKEDYENIASPSSSTSSGPVYERQPGFEKHGHEVVVPRRPKIKHKIKRKKITNFMLGGDHDFYTASRGRRKDGTMVPTPPSKAKPKRDTVPMRLRALPQSFWQQPNNMNNNSPGSLYPVLPPVVNKEVAEIRPVTPPEERTETDVQERTVRKDEDVVVTKPEKTVEKVTIKDDKEKTEKEVKKEKIDLLDEGVTGATVTVTTTAPPRTRTVRTVTSTVPNTDLLFSLFDGVDPETKRQTVKLKRGRPKRIHLEGMNAPRPRSQDNDPYMVDNIAERLFPVLSLENRKQNTNPANPNVTTTLHYITLNGEDEKSSVSLPAVRVETNYSQMLSELVMHI